MSKDRMVDDGNTIFGRVVRRQHVNLEWGEVIPGMYVRSLSQEHGIVVVPESEPFDEYNVGELLYVLPVHSCMTANCLRHQGYTLTSGEVLERMKN